MKITKKSKITSKFKVKTFTISTLFLFTKAGLLEVIISHTSSLSKTIIGIISMTAMSKRFPNQKSKIHSEAPMVPTQHTC